MLISYPFLTDQASEDADAEAIRYSFTGSYPLNNFGEWHNGVHLVAPTLSDGSLAPVRAVADGKVVCAIAPKTESKTDKAQNYGAFSDNPEWTDNGLVILEHTTEIGHDGTDPVALKFYSVYMHLKGLGKIQVKNVQGQTLERELKDGDKLWRKDVVGEAGQIYGQPRHLHFEISMDDANLEKLLGHAPDQHPKTEALPSSNGRTDVVFGSTHVYLPVGTPLSTAEPTTHLGTHTTEALQTPLWVQVDYASGHATLTSYDANGDNAGRPIAGEAQLGTSQCSEIEGEYKLYEQANKRHNSLSATQKAQSSPSGWYELLRFGRVLSSDPLPAEAEHWRKIKTPAGEKWVNLDAPGTFKFSDADFPAYLGWQCIGDDSEGASGQDQRCDSLTLRSLLLRQFADMAQREQAMAKTLDGRKLLASKATNPSSDAWKNKLRKLICKFPSEFDKSTIEARYAHVKDEPYFKENPKNWDDLKEHIQAVCADLPEDYKKAQWHFHPEAFVNVMRRCGWLSKRELVRCVPSHALRTAGGRTFWEPVNPPDTQGLIANQHRISLNKTFRKYGISNNPLRMASFLGNAIQETSWLSSLEESGGSGYWYAPWFGRGFLQLTHAENYFKYWRWRGRNIPEALNTALKQATKTEADKAANQRSSTALRDNNFPALTPEMKDWRNQVRGGESSIPIGESLVAPTDSAGFYAAISKMNEYADSAHVLERQSVATVDAHGHSTGTHVYYRSPAFWKVAAAVNLPGAIGHTNYSGLNGFNSRCSAYGVALAVLTEMNFPSDIQANALNYPEGYIPRRGE